MNSLNEKYLENIKFGQTELATLRMLGEYQGKQILYSKQSPEVLQGLQKVAVIEGSDCRLIVVSRRDANSPALRQYQPLMFDGDAWSRAARESVDAHKTRQNSS